MSFHIENLNQRRFWAASDLERIYCEAQNLEDHSFYLDLPYLLQMLDFCSCYYQASFWSLRPFSFICPHYYVCLIIHYSDSVRVFTWLWLLAHYYLVDCLILGQQTDNIIYPQGVIWQWCSVVYCVCHSGHGVYLEGHVMSLSHSNLGTCMCLFSFRELSVIRFKILNYCSNRNRDSFSITDHLHYNLPSTKTAGETLWGSPGEEGGEGKVYIRRGRVLGRGVQMEEAHALFPNLTGPSVRPEGSFKSSGSSKDTMACCCPPGEGTTRFSNLR